MISDMIFNLYFISIIGGIIFSAIAILCIAFYSVQEFLYNLKYNKLTKED